MTVIRPNIKKIANDLAKPAGEGDLFCFSL
jgi:hypothetical protein